MNFIVPLLLVLMALVTSALSAQSTSTPSEDALYVSTKALLNKYAYNDYPDQGARDAAQTLRAKGPEAVPALIRLFKESAAEDQYQSATIGALLSLEGDKTEAIRFVEGELSKDPQDWGSWRWVSNALIKLPKVDEAAARRASLRALESENRAILMCALDSLRHIGQQEDIRSLESFLAKRRAAVSAASGIDGVAFKAESTVSEIKARDQTVKTTPISSPAQSVTHATEVSKPALVESTELSSKNGHWIWIALGAVVIVLGTFVIVRKR